MAEKITQEMRARAETETAALVYRMTHHSQFAKDLAHRAADPDGGREAVFVYLNLCLDDGELLSPELLAVGALAGQYRLDPRYNSGISAFNIEDLFKDFDG